MTKKDFKLGQVVYLKTTSCHHPWETEKMIEGIVTKVGRKYITVNIGLENVRFDIENNFHPVFEYGFEAKYVLYLTRKEVEDYWQSEFLKDYIIRNIILVKDIPLESLERFAKELGL